MPHGTSAVGVDIGGFAEAPTPELFTRWIQVGVFYPFMRTHTTFGTPDQEPWSYGPEHEALNRRAIATGKRIRALDSRAARWIAADALRELQSDAVQRRLRRKSRNQRSKR